MRNHNHGLWMMLGCILPLFLIFLLPVFGVKSNISFLVFVVAMFSCHFFMMGKHGEHDHPDKDANNGNKDTNDNKENHEGHEKKEGQHGCH